MKDFFDWLLDGKTLGIIGIILAVYIYKVQKKQSAKPNKAIEETKEELKEIKALLQTQSLDIAKANKPSDELSSTDKQTIEAFDRYNTNPQTAEDWFVKGFTAHENNNYDNAITYYNKSIELNPNYTEAYCNLGIAYAEGKQDYDIAIECFSKAIELDPNHANAYAYLGTAYAGGKQDYDVAIKYFGKAIELDPNYAIAYYNIGLAYGRQGNEEKKIEYYKDAAKLGVEEAQWWLCDNNITW